MDRAGTQEETDAIQLCLVVVCLLDVLKILSPEIVIVNL